MPAAGAEGREPPNHDFSGAPCGLARTDGKGFFLAVNPTFCAWVGRDAATLVGGMRLQDLLSMGGRIFQTHWAPLLQLQGSVSEVKLELRRGDGVAIPMILNASRRELADGRVQHEIAVFIARDRDRYEKELLLSRKRLEELVAQEARLRAESTDRALFAEQMVGIVSHDLRNPLSAIHMAALSLARGDPMTERQRRTVDRIVRSTDRATRLVADLLDFTLTRTGRNLAVKAAPLDLHAVVAAAVEELSAAFPGRPLVHEPSGERACHADADRLEQLVGNLVGNAMAYGEPGAPVIVRTAGADGMRWVSVSNRGAPIAPERLPLLFQPMVRGENAGGAGVGLGLYIIGEIAKAHDGTITVVSSAESGTVFTFGFPAA